ncbi:hypothetical protein JTE90_025981 [Oedothorax gibbosus]|uniref:Nucleoporin Nup43 n=1 Tax=Oedothorax gibbosus TaxID=931172 RepID=A0AAV6U8A9_9ARAC|nr:hypothetical protein JTE90_025981 [Oedothorax gibbosus]
MSHVKIKFVSRKVSKVRWKPKDSSVFVTGSYDDEKNNICVWKFPDLSMKQDDENEIDEDPQLTACLPFKGCVTDLKVVTENLLFASSSLGDVHIVNYSDEEVNCVHTWKNTHSFSNGSASVTGLSVKGQELVSVGEDGKLCLFNYSSRQKVQEIEGSDVCSYTAVTYLRHQEICAGNSLGYLQLWDLRTTSEAANHLLHLSREQQGVSALNVHPTQSHILAAGYEDGILSIWDMRNDRKPMCFLEGHSGPISELMFHPSNPDFLYTCSWDGSVWQWDSSGLRSSASYASTNDSQSQTATKGNPWLLCDANRQKLEVLSLFSSSTCVNTIDLIGSSLIWGTDNEELCILNNILV